MRLVLISFCPSLFDPPHFVTINPIRHGLSAEVNSDCKKPNFTRADKLTAIAAAALELSKHQTKNGDVGHTFGTFMHLL